jgi:V8-like Glu-specific endopeptidase
MTRDDIRENPMALIESVVRSDNPRLLLDDTNQIASPLPPEAIQQWGPALQALDPAAVASWASAVCHIRALVYQTPAVNGQFATLAEQPIGTGFLIAPSLVLTNAHVASVFASNGGSLVKERAANLTFASDGKNPNAKIAILDIRAWGTAEGGKIGDWAVLEIDPQTTLGRNPLVIDDAPKNGSTGMVVTIGFPVGYDIEMATHPQYTVFPGPGYGHPAVPPRKSFCLGQAAVIKKAQFKGLIHDCSVLPGSSGSPVISLVSGMVVGLHYKGKGNGFDARYNAALLGEELKVIAGLLNTPSGRPLITGVKAKRLSRFTDAGFGPSFGMMKDSDDFRDLVFTPQLAQLPESFPEKINLPTVKLNQQDKPACTAYALVNALAVMDKGYDGKPPFSTRMAYEMARLHDEFPEQFSQGSTLRGVIKGFYHNGLALAQEGEWKAKPWRLTYDAAKQARNTAPGAYYRVRPSLSDIQSAVHEASAVLVAANVHKGWIKPADTENKIVFKRETTGLGHAFVIVGYDRDGFVVFNSAGPEWSSWNGNPGCAHWRYEDWAENMLDAWVLRVAVPAPSVFGKALRRAALSAKEAPLPRRSEVLGHVIISDEGKLANFGRAAMDIDAVAETANFISKRVGRKYNHLLFIAHSEVTSEEEMLRWSLATKPYFKDNGIYPINMACDPSFATAFRETLSATMREAKAQAGSAESSTERLFESKLHQFGSKLWKARRLAVQRACRTSGDFYQAVAKLFLAARENGMCVHALAHHGGSEIIAALLASAEKEGSHPKLNSLHLANAALSPSQFEFVTKRLSLQTHRSSGNCLARPPRLNQYIASSLGSTSLQPDARWLSVVERGFGQPLFNGTFRGNGMLHAPHGWLLHIINMLSDENSNSTCIWSPQLLNKVATSILRSNGPAVPMHQTWAPKSWLVD